MEIWSRETAISATSQISTVHLWRVQKMQRANGAKKLQKTKNAGIVANHMQKKQVEW